MAGMGAASFDNVLVVMGHQICNNKSGNCLPHQFMTI